MANTVKLHDFTLPSFRSYTELKRLSTPIWVVAIIVLIIDPLSWLANSWVDPVYDSQGLYIAFVVGALFICSLLSGKPTTHSDINTLQQAFYLLIAMALLRLLGQFLGINVISALALIVDVYALALLMGVERRVFSISPFWLAVVFSFSLPVDRIIQRLLGYPLQLISADGSCFLMSPFFNDLQCHGVDMILNHQQILVDLPCSGARGLMQILILFSLIACVKQPGFKQSLAGLVIAIVGAYMGNVLRISLLALGIAFPDTILLKSLGDINVMQAPWHDMIGLFSLTVAAIPLMIWAYYLRPTDLSNPAVFVKRNSARQNKPPVKIIHSPIAPLTMLIVAIVITQLKAHPVDIVRLSASIYTPQFINGYYARPQAMSVQEQRFFTQYGGLASKVIYGDLTLLQVSTKAPLRHLHDPKDCLTGAGHQVQYLGISDTPLKAAVYKSVDPQGRSWRVLVTFISDQHQLTSNIAEVVWLWLKQPSSRWTMVQRVTQWDKPNRDLKKWDQSLIQALELPPMKTYSL